MIEESNVIYEPTDAIFLVDLVTIALTVAIYLLILAITVKMRSPGARNLRDAAQALTGLARDLDWGRTKFVLAAAVLTLTALGSLVAYSSSEALHVFIFRLNDERTIPTFYNTIQLLTAATLALLLAYEGRGKRRLAWILFAFAFIGAGIDETADMHPRLQMHTGLPEEFVLLPIALFMLTALAILWRQMGASRVAIPLLFAGGTLVVISQAFDTNHAKWSQRIVEEGLELTACALFVLAMLAVVRAADSGERVRQPRDRPEYLRYSRT